LSSYSRKEIQVPKKHQQNRSGTNRYSTREYHQEITHEKTPQGEKKHTVTHTTEAGAAIGSVAGPEGAIVGGTAGAVAGTGAKVAGAGANTLAAPGNFIGSHSAGGVLLSSLLLLTLATWQGFGKPTLDAAWNGVPWNTTIDGKLILGGIAFCVVMAMIAESNDDAHSLIVWMLVALWIIFVVMNGSSTISSIFNWFSSGTKTTTTTPTQTPNPIPTSVTQQINKDFGIQNAIYPGYGGNLGLQSLQQQLANINKLFTTPQQTPAHAPTNNQQQQMNNLITKNQ
jgi:hypothetical protein